MRSPYTGKTVKTHHWYTENTPERTRRKPFRTPAASGVGLAGPRRLEKPHRPEHTRHSSHALACPQSPQLRRIWEGDFWVGRVATTVLQPPPPLGLRVGLGAGAAGGAGTPPQSPSLCAGDTYSHTLPWRLPRSTAATAAGAQLATVWGAPSRFLTPVEEPARTAASHAREPDADRQRPRSCHSHPGLLPRARVGEPASSSSCPVPQTLRKQGPQANEAEWCEIVPLSR